MNELLSIAEAWSFWRSLPDASVARRVELPDGLSESLALVVQGVRRCGKSTLLQQMIERYGLDPERCAFLNFEDPRLARSLTFETLERLVTEFRALHPDGRLTFFLDEIQWVEGWQRWLRTQLDRPRGNAFVLTGSNAHLLSGELSSTLTGRHLTVELFPFDLEEYRRVRPDAGLEDFLTDGGFPEPLTMSDGDRLRRQYFSDIVERDVRERVRARSSRPLRQLAQMSFESAGSEMSVRRVAAATGVAVDTASGYLEACEAAYLLFGCSYFSYSARKRSARNRKYYPVDTGLRRVAVTATGRDLGKMLECAVFLALRRRYGEVHYWRGRGEVDFVVQTGDRVLPVQVTWGEPEERHHRALEEFYELHPRAAEALFVSAADFDTLESRLP